MSTVFLVRHGEADDNAAEDPGSSDRGRRQVAALASRLHRQTFSALWHGPRRRAAQTAALLHVAMPALTPQPANVLDYRTPVPSTKQRREYSPDQLAWLVNVPTEERDIDGTQLNRFWHQLATFANEHAAAGPLLAVTHAFVIAWFVRSVMHAPPSRWMGLNSDNTGLTVIEIRPDGPRLRSLIQRLRPPAGPEEGLATRAVREA